MDIKMQLKRDYDGSPSPWAPTLSSEKRNLFLSMQCAPPVVCSLFFQAAVTTFLAIHPDYIAP